MTHLIRADAKWSVDDMLSPLFPKCPTCGGDTSARHLGPYSDIGFMCIKNGGPDGENCKILWLSSALEKLKTFEEYRDLMVAVYRSMGR